MHQVKYSKSKLQIDDLSEIREIDRHEISKIKGGELYFYDDGSTLSIVENQFGTFISSTDIDGNANLTIIEK